MKKIICCSVLGLILVGCSNKTPLSGERQDIILSEVDEREIDKTPVVIDPSSISINGKARLLWTNSMIYGKTKTFRMISSTILKNNKLFSIDAGGLVYAFDAQTGNLLWKRTTTIKGKDGQVGGALAYSNGKLIVTSSFAEAFALDETTGDILWRIKLPACCKGDGITIGGNQVYLLCDNGTLQTLDLNTGKILWSHGGMMTDITYIGSAGVAIENNTIYLSYPSGEVLALMDSGNQLWNAMMSKFSFTNSIESFSHPKATPVIKGNLVYFTNSNKQITAFDKSTGSVVWKKDFGGLETPLISGNSIFLLNSFDELVCLNKDTGALKWTYTLPQNYNNSWFSSTETVVWYGPIQTNQGIVITSSNGTLITVSPYDGKLIFKTVLESNEEIPSRPVFVEDKMYFITNNGTVQAYKFPE